MVALLLLEECHSAIFNQVLNCDTIISYNDVNHNEINNIFTNTEIKYFNLKKKFYH
jgi:hypothetical protein